ncbi:MAG: hypothetical protein GFH27_549309n137 [Chloroflexi bacterium AL-W]|nr:hypothetical protein [Chloroflexi bacterium AL-N1]NOK69839.1 hypothetical protein [Chloroflexi bacterium AL-N10]NOK73557.1 hypothetical protein [Chloroflexi bacterium AL-N5]NOK84009.1 hypothetical protein [Chloroflexi bacterium AL-W]NOK87888.1 hypothetical protein [Chloroflexi bacterium AL-N15]
MQKMKHIAIKCLPALLLAILSFHFLMTLAFLTPLNPVKLRFDSVNQDYMNPYFFFPKLGTFCAKPC